MGWEYPSDLVWKAQELYCVDRLSYTAVAEAVGVSATTLKAWGQRYNWAQKREELAQAGKIPDARPAPRCKIGTKAEAVAALHDAVERKLGLALADPDKITSQTVTDIKRCLELVADLEASLPKETVVEEEKKRGLSRNMADSIYKALGISEDEPV